jgi:phage shock protein E
MKRFGFVLNAQRRAGLPLVRAVKEKDLLVVDVRTPEEVAATGKVDRAVNIPLNALEANKAFFGDDKTRPLLFYCAKGVRSAQAAGYAQSLGFNNAFSTVDAQSAQKLIDQTNSD